MAQRGYRHTDIERVLPVTFDRDDEPAVALVIVLDRSWSMNGTAMDLSKSAAEGAANALAPSQMLGVLTFNDTSTWDVPLGRVRESRPELHAAIGRIKASGPTAIFPALRNAYDALAGVRVRAKHVILLSDGQSDPEDFEGLVRKMSAAHITVSTVALGPDADAALLRNLASWGGGRSYVVQDAQQIPEIFVTEARNAATPEAEDASNILAKVREQMAFIEPPVTLPALQGRNLVTKKPEAIEWLSTQRGDPLLTTWPAGLGRTAMFAADLDGAWTRGWIAWRGLGRLLDGTIRALAPRRAPPSSLTVEAGERVGSQAQLTITLDARDRDGQRDDGLSPTVEVRSATRPPRRLAVVAGELRTVRRPRCRRHHRAAVLLGAGCGRPNGVTDSRRRSIRRTAFRRARCGAVVGDRPHHGRHVPACRPGSEPRPANRRDVALPAGALVARARAAVVARRHRAPPFQR